MLFLSLFHFQACLRTNTFRKVKKGTLAHGHTYKLSIFVSPLVGVAHTHTRTHTHAHSQRFWSVMLTKNANGENHEMRRKEDVCEGEGVCVRV